MAPIEPEDVYMTDEELEEQEAHEDQDRRAEQGEYDEDYCDYCEREGHTFRTCPARDDEPVYWGEGEWSDGR